MKKYVWVFCFFLFATVNIYAEHNNTVGKMTLTKFQKRAIVIKKMNDAKEVEARQLEEDGFCPCSVQRP
jgi:hypothetical protein